jgi:hypothetical protein
MPLPNGLGLRACRRRKLRFGLTPVAVGVARAAVAGLRDFVSTSANVLGRRLAPARIRAGLAGLGLARLRHCGRRWLASLRGLDRAGGVLRLMLVRLSVTGHHVLFSCGGQGCPVYKRRVAPATPPARHCWIDFNGRAKQARPRWVHPGRRSSKHRRRGGDARPRARRAACR